MINDHAFPESRRNITMTTSPSPARRIGVGLIGAGNWALHGHARVLNLVPGYRLVAVQSRRRAASEQAARQHGFRDVVDTVEELVSHPEVDLVVVTTTAPQHADGVRAAIAAGRDVFSEWPLTPDTSTSLSLADAAKRAGVRNLVGLQRRLAPHNRFIKDLLADGYVGEIRSVRMHVSVSGFGAERGQALAWTIPAENFSSVISIYAGHFLDMLFDATGWPTSISALALNQFPVVTLSETGQSLPTTSPDELVMIGRLNDDAVVTVQVEGGKRNGTGVQIDITGTKGDLRIVNRSAFGDVGDDYQVLGSQGERQPLEPLPVPASYRILPASNLPSAVQELGEVYAAHVRDVAASDGAAPGFSDAVRLHRLFDAITLSTETGQRVDL
ncbi:Gfo/Idh/MocA family protein [Sphingomonas faeni]|uniref:Gfo/Idh/MocA family protein n=1 Tax=Sphingomonas faeni TaxID=185950 RepID=UPI00335D8BC3